MKTIFIIPILLLPLLFTSCEKVIPIDLNDSEPQYVMEAVLLEGTHDFTVKITKTTSYFNPGTPERILNAVVTLYDGNNTINAVFHTSNGIYVLPNYTANEGETYRLKVEIGDKVYEASSTIPSAVAINSSALGIFEDDGEEFVGMEYDLNDPAGVDNYYQVIHHINGQEVIEQIPYTYDDFTIDGTLINDYIFIDQNITTGDTIDLELRSIDKNSFDFFTTLESAISGDEGGPGATAPANPTNNWSNLGLGYFGTGNSSFQRTIVP